MAWTYRPTLDGLRALAMYLIVLFHTNVGWAEGAFIAVNLFFVLSGYLVCNVILNEIDKTGRLSLRNFYARRVRRLLPAAVVAIVGTSVVFLLISSVVRRMSIIGDAQSALLYVANWRFIHQANDYFATNVDKSPFLHFWTLGIEEQFYLVFPLVILLLARWPRRQVMFAGLAVLFVLSLLAQWYWSGADPNHAYYGTDARLYQLVAGALLAVGMRYWPVHVPPRMSRAIALVGMLSFLVLSTNLVDMSRPLRGVVGTLACVMIIAGLMLLEKQPLGWLLSRRTPVYLGTISYATYLWHWPAILVLQEFLALDPVPLAVLAGVIATAMAAASAELVEFPIRKSKRLNPFPWSTVVAGVATSALVAVAVIPAVLGQDRQPALAQGTQAAAKPKIVPTSASSRATKEKMPKRIDWKKIDADRGEEHSCTAADPSKCTVMKGSGPHVLVIGDSHGRMLSKMFTNLAEKHDWTLSMNVRVGCLWQEQLINTHSSKPRQERCTSARVGWYDDVLPELDPDLVILTGKTREKEKPWADRIERRDGKSEPLLKMIRTSSRQTLNKIDKVVPKTLILQRIITPDSFQPSECLATQDNPAKCAVPVPLEPSTSDAFYIAESADRENVFTANINKAMCPSAPVCLPVVDGEVVWRDKHHLTAEYAAGQSRRVYKIIEKTGVLDDFGGA